MTFREQLWPRDSIGRAGHSAHASFQPTAFTLIELMIIVAILGILAAIVFPTISTSTDQARIEAIATNVTNIRGMITFHAGAGDVALTAGGAPATLDPAWFRGGHMPEHAWTSAPMVIQAVALAADQVYPAVKTFNPLVAGAANVWYNSTNGAFCALIPPKATDAESLDLFDRANKVAATSINQTTN